MMLKKTIWTAMLCTGFIGALLISAEALPTKASAAAAENQEISPVDRGPHVLPPF